MYVLYAGGVYEGISPFRINIIKSGSTVPVTFRCTTFHEKKAKINKREYFGKAANIDAGSAKRLGYKSLDEYFLAN